MIYAISLLLMKNYSGKAAKVQTLLTTDLHLCYSKYPKKRLLTIKQGLLKIEKIIILLSIWFPKKNCSTDFCPTYFNGKILKEFDKSMKTRTILIDLKITFNTIDREVLLQKLYAIGFPKHIVNYFKSFLSNRSFLWLN